MDSHFLSRLNAREIVRGGEHGDVAKVLEKLLVLVEDRRVQDAADQVALSKLPAIGKAQVLPESRCRTRTKDIRRETDLEVAFFSPTTG